jgi:uncharacterized iron-regulated membrane protein
MLKRLHRILGLSFVLFWLIEAATGAAIEACWWLDTAVYREPATVIRPEVVGSSLRSLSPEASSIYSAWSAGTVPGQLKIYYKDRTGKDRVRRISHAGDLVYDVDAADLSSMEGVLRVLAEAHETLLAGSFGLWMTALSGVLLSVNLCIGMWMACRRPIRLKAMFLWRPTPTRLGRALQAHRLAGVWVVLPALALATTGVALALGSGLELLGWGRTVTQVAANEGATREPTPSIPEPSIERIITQALATATGSSFSAITLPTAQNPWYEVRLRSPSDGRAFWGSRLVRVNPYGSPLSGTAGSPFVSDKISTMFYPIHTGQLGGMWGQIAAFAAGVLLSVTAVLGVVLWRNRSTARRAVG